MQPHIEIRRPNRWPVGKESIVKTASISLILLLIVANGSEAIVKQQQQRSDDSQQQANNNGPQQQQQSAFNNHQQQLSSSSSASSSVSSQQSSQPSYSVSSSSSSQSSQSPQSVSSQVNGVQSPQIPAQVSSSAQQVGQQQSSGRDYTNYASVANGAGSNGNNVAPKSYMDSMSASASNTDQSYQAAANSVNMALANSGIFGPGSSYGSSSQSQQAGNAQQSASPSNSQSLNPLHYFYYPSKESSSSVQAKASSIGQQQGLDGAASNSYQSMAFPAYSDQLNSALSNIGASPEAAASNQDPSYLPQPSGVDQFMYNQQQQQQQQSGAHQQINGNQGYNGDLSGYSSNLSPVPVQPQQQQQQQQQSNQQQNSQPGSISFNGPTSNGLGSSLSGQSDNSYSNSNLGSSGNQQPINNYQNNLFNQLGDLSTSNFGNNAGGLSSVASYMSPNQQQHQPQQHDLFSGLGGQQFNQAASQLSPATVSPPNQQGGLGSGSSLFNAATSLFGQQQAAMGNANPAAGSANLFANQQYLNSFLTPQQYGQLAGQMATSDQPLVSAASNPSSSSSAVSGSGSGSSSKRFGISSFIMPMLALAGLSLLIPTMSNIGTAVGRKKRSVEDRASSSKRQQQISYDSMNGASQLAKEHSIGEYMDKIERYYSIYKNAVESDDCMNRLICEFGDAVKDVTGKSVVVTVIEKLVPTWMTGKMHLFKEAALDNKEGKEKCKKYICHSNKHNQ